MALYKKIGGTRGRESERAVGIKIIEREVSNTGMDEEKNWGRGD